MMYFKAPHDSFEVITVPYVSGVVVASHYHFLGSNLSHLPEFVLSLEWFVLNPYLKLSEHELLVLLNVINKDYFLVSVPVPVLLLILLVVIRVSLDDIPSLPDSRFAIDPLVEL